MFYNQLNRDSEVGTYYWRQYSIWELAPKDSIRKYVNVESFSSEVCTFYLTRVVSKTQNGWTTEVVTSTEGVPDEVLNWRTS